MRSERHSISGLMQMRLALPAALVLCLLVFDMLQASPLGFDVVSHRYALSLEPALRSIVCTDTMEVLGDGDGTDSLTLLLHPAFRITAVAINDRKHDAVRSREYVLLTGLQPSESNTIIISYEGEVTALSEFSRIGDSSALFRTEELLPRGKENLRSVRANITVPSGWKAVASGALMNDAVDGDRRTSTWELNARITTAGWISAGPYVVRETRRNGIRYSVYLMHDDTLRADSILLRTYDVVEFCSRRFTPYRFPAMTVAEVDDWVGGGNVLAASAPSMIIIKKHAFTSQDNFNRAETILPHEVAHQWWPLTVFLEPRDMAFLSEGLCEFTALLFGEASGTMTVRDSLGTHQLLRSLVTRAAKGLDLPLQEERDLRTLPSHYLKAAYVHNMLKQIIGPALYDTLLKQYATRFEGRASGISEFEALAEELSAKDLSWFFDQWIRKGGIPKLKMYNVKSVRRNSLWETRGRIRVVGYEKFTTFADVGVRTAGQFQTARLWLGLDSTGVYRNDLPFSLTTDSKPDLIRFDPAANLLKLQRMAPKLSDLRDPGHMMVIVGTVKNAQSLLDRAREDSVHITGGGSSCTIKPDSAVTLMDLQRERVLLYGTPEQNSVVAEYTNSFPLKFVGDSIIVDADPLYDSSLTLLQVIDNPFSPGGIWCWIAPLSPDARNVLQPYDASWVLSNDGEIVAKGTWRVKDEDLEVEIP